MAEIQNKAFLKETEIGLKKTPGSYGFYTKDCDSSQIEIGKSHKGAPTIAPGTGLTSDNMSKSVGMRKVIHTTGGY